MQIKAKHDDLRTAQKRGKGRAMLPEILEQIRWGRGEGVARVRMVC